MLFQVLCGLEPIFYTTHPNEEPKYSLLDVGCGEGKTMSYFKEQGYEVTGTDYSKYGIEHNHPEVIDDFIQGDSKKNIT